ncbi:MAG TPA: DUF3943 domain-containing protein [Noviherbaspirillum sp.]|jgi:hypothetical protein|uniref:DUF3943 domain-containing protein n=1 Tax=Noviherbaspirillum sp. TaxID=1926288 RepID=UPI002F95F330
MSARSRYAVRRPADGATGRAKHVETVNAQEEEVTDTGTPIAPVSTCMRRAFRAWPLAMLSLCSAVAPCAVAAEGGRARLLLSEAALEHAVQRGEVLGRGERLYASRSGQAGRDGTGGQLAVGNSKSYALPALEIIAFQFLLNRFDNRFVGPEYDVSASSIRRNLRSSWVVDRDPFEINQFGHPYQGTVYFGLARSAGLNFWESFGYTFAGSALWEIAGETTLPSRNDQITTSFAGTFFGESLFRMANLVLERGNGLSPRWRELMAAAVSPPTAFNRAAFPGRFGQVFASKNPATFMRLQLGGSGTLRSAAGASTALKRNEAVVDFALDYGLPGKDGYDYTRPFDYFNFQARASSARGLESVNNRGLVLGAAYEAGPHYRGIWGLYGSFDYLAPQVFRLSSTALSLGTTGQWQLSDAVVAQGTAMAGAGFTSTGTIRGSADREYNYGFAPQALLALRLIFGEAIAIDVTARNYFAGRIADGDTEGRDRVLRADASLTMRVHGRHAVALKYVSSRRNSSFPETGERSQRRDTLGLYYTLLGADKLGAVRW